MSDIVGYTYKTENFCPACVVDRVSPGADVDMSTERWLDRLAEQLRIDRQDEYSFDSEDFPKIILSWQVETNETCENCGVEL